MANVVTDAEARVIKKANIAKVTVWREYRKPHQTARHYQKDSCSGRYSSEGTEGHRYSRIRCSTGRRDHSAVSVCYHMDSHR